MVEPKGAKPILEKETFLDPDRIFRQLKIKDDMIIADFGCGSGFLTFAAAKIAINGGKVFAIDIRPSALQYVEGQKKLLGRWNVETVWADLEQPESLSKATTDDSVDLVIISSLMFQTKKHNKFLTEARRILKNDGRVLVIDWHPDKPMIGPPVEERVSKEDTIKEVEKAGFKLDRELEMDDFHYGLEFGEV